MGILGTRPLYLEGERKEGGREEEKDSASCVYVCSLPLAMPGMAVRKKGVVVSGEGRREKWGSLQT